MSQTWREQLQKRFDFEAWKSAPREAVHVSAGGLFEVGSRLGRWSARRAEPVNVPGARAAIRSMWEEDPSAQALMRVDLIEAASGTAARELLLEQLGQFESPQIERLSDPPAGDLAFSVPGDTMILFSRSNVVALVRNAGRQVVPVVEFARLVDGRLVSSTGTSQR